mgnify:CR=1 FL=1
MAIYKDTGHGVTIQSLMEFDKIRPILGRIVAADAGLEPLKTEARKESDIEYTVEYNLILKDDRGNEVWLSGCNCGYGGTGPHGTYELLQKVGLIPQQTKFEDTPIPSQHRCHWP